MVLRLLVLLLCLLGSTSIAGTDCPLYEGFRDSRCFWGDEINRFLTNSHTAWVVEFYSSWCGHCHHFAPTWKEVATRVKGWSRVIRLGEIDCSRTENRDVCQSYHVQAFPTIKFFNAYEKDPHSKNIKRFLGSRKMEAIVSAIIDHVSRQSIVPSLLPLVTVLNNEFVDKTTIIIFEEEDSLVGSEIILDWISQHESIFIRRVLYSNLTVELIRHYSILDFPSLLILPTTGHYTIISKSSAGDNDIVEYFESKIKEVLGLSQMNTPTTSIVAVPVSTPTRIKPAKRVTWSDLTSTISYALRTEVSHHEVISGEDFYTLYQFVYQLEKAFQFINDSISSELRTLRYKLDSKYYITGFITSREWKTLLRNKLSSNIFPETPYWVSCKGSQNYFRGYPCGLWGLMHSVTIISLKLPELHLVGTSKVVLHAMVKFVLKFFTCEECRLHFTELVASLMRDPLSYDGDAILWLWEAHNIVNDKLKDAKSSDPVYPKVLFPTYQVCPYCYVKLKKKSIDVPSWDNVGFKAGDSLIRSSSVIRENVFLWNKTAVFLYLCNFYGQFNTLSHNVLVHAGWPRKYPLSADKHYKTSPYNIGSARQFQISGTHVVIYFFVLVIIVTLLFKYKLRRTRFKLL